MVQGDPGVPLRSLRRRNPHSRKCPGHFLMVACWLTAGHSGDQAELVPVLRKLTLAWRKQASEPESR